MDIEWAADMWRAGGDSPGFMPDRPKKDIYSIIKLFRSLTSTPFHRVGSSAIDYFSFAISSSIIDRILCFYFCELGNID